MKIRFFQLIIFFASLNLLMAQNPNYDENLAKKLGSDDYGMKKYFFVILKTGSNTTSDKKFTDSCFKSHFQNMNKMVEQNKLIVAGPMGKNDKSYRGIFIIDAESKEEVEKLLDGDLSIKEKLLEAEIYNWYGSAALREYLPYSEKIWKSKP